ncbi:MULTISPECIES: DUF6875 domain-containing protein [unclassified Gemella]|uniref:DUF6875 domain-containing protein n=1 Tax=unclassified Gemella TaxID=2624949 RepID=UPI001C05BC7B|nr:MULTISPECIES: hypothetical protein [unclassified Gemella]MBU0279072.1 hypothetical protein [Gemella sp. zg-1178]QWQ39122.1 hypothetical protein KMP11_01960 [Gemella sp. zg-570]
MNEKFLKYIEKIDMICPYLKSSIDKNLLNCTEVVLSSENTDEKLSKYIFYKSLILTEKFRKARHNLSERDMIFYTKNIIFDVDDLSYRQWEKIISWSHYTLKELFSSEQIMFGKFWKGEEIVSKITNKMLPIPEITFISIRTAVKSRDPRLLSKIKEFAKIIKESNFKNKVEYPSYILKNYKLLEFEDLCESGYYESLKRKLTDKLLKK